jgi:hypothetical protein
MTRKLRRCSYSPCRGACFTTQIPHFGQFGILSQRCRSVGGVSLEVLSPLQGEKAMSAKPAAKRVGIAETEDMFECPPSSGSAHKVRSTRWALRIIPVLFHRCPVNFYV